MMKRLFDNTLFMVVFVVVLGIIPGAILLVIIRKALGLPRTDPPEA